MTRQVPDGSSVHARRSVAAEVLSLDAHGGLTVAPVGQPRSTVVVDVEISGRRLATDAHFLSDRSDLLSGELLEVLLGFPRPSP